MTIKAIYSKRPEIRKQVYDQYPVTKREKGCAIERDKREWLRAEKAKELYAQIEGKAEYK